MVTAWSGWKSIFVGQEACTAFLTVVLICRDASYMPLHRSLSLFLVSTLKAIVVLPILEFFVMCLNDNLCFTRCLCF